MKSSYKISLAIEKSREWEKRIPIGVFYQNDNSHYLWRKNRK